MSKRIKFLSVITAFLFALFMLFSLSYATKESNHDCVEQQDCTVCIQIDEYQRELNVFLSSGHLCENANCSICYETDALESSLTRLNAAEHICVGVECSVCCQINAYREFFRKLFTVCAVLTVAVVAVGIFHSTSKIKNTESRHTTLITLKVKLSA